jgi:hypothetical protein
MLRNFFIFYFFLVVLVLTGMGLRGCKSSREPLEVFADMDRQNKSHEQSKSTFFADGRSDRPKVPGTVPTTTALEAEYAHLAPPHAFQENDYFATGKKADGEFGTGLPIDVTNDAFDQGQELYGQFCTVCHGRTGDGQGVLKDPRYGFGTIASLLDQRIKDLPRWRYL